MTEQVKRGPGRPASRSQPDADLRAQLEAMWFDPDNNTPRAIREFAGNALSREVALWELKNWFGAKRRQEGA